MIKPIFRHMVDLGLVTCSDDQLIYAETQAEHGRIVTELLPRLDNNKLSISVDICV